MSRTHTRRPVRLLALALALVTLVIGSTAAASSAPPGSDTPGTPADGSGTPPDGYVRLVDDTAFLTVVVPERWTTIDTAPSSNDDGTPQAYILATAGPDLDTFNSTFTSGVLFQAVPFQPDPETTLGGAGLSQGCETIEIEPYEDPIFTGFVQVGTNCGQSGGSWNMIVANPADESFTAVVQVQVETGDEREHFDSVLSSFTYAGDPTIEPSMMVPSGASAAAAGSAAGTTDTTTVAGDR